MTDQNETTIKPNVWVNPKTGIDVPYGWVSFYRHVTHPYPTLPIVGYFVETKASLNGGWPRERCKSLLSFWLGRDGIPECMQ